MSERGHPKFQLSEGDIYKDRETSGYYTALLTEIYADNTRDALSLIEKDPDQIAIPHSGTGLTPLHVAVFRENLTIVKELLKNSRADVFLKDEFGRSALDMLSYTTNETIHQVMLEAAYPDASRRLEDEVYDEARAAGDVRPLRPKNPSP